MDFLVQRLNTMRAEQSIGPYKIDDLEKRRKLRAMEKFMERHQHRCPMCKGVTHLAQD
jgi:hypothetical protein